MWPFLTVHWVGLQCVIVVFPDHTNLLFYVCSLFCCALLGVFFEFAIISVGMRKMVVLL